MTEVGDALAMEEGAESEMALHHAEAAESVLPLQDAADDLADMCQSFLVSTKHLIAALWHDAASGCHKYHEENHILRPRTWH